MIIELKNFDRKPMVEAVEEQFKILIPEKISIDCKEPKIVNVLAQAIGTIVIAYMMQNSNESEREKFMKAIVRQFQVPGDED